MHSSTVYQGASELRHLGVIRARGADAATFLQGQLTNDVLSLGPERAILAGFCSAKGRLQASFWVTRPAPDELLLVCAADLLAPTLKRLSMFVLRSKCKLDDATAELPLVGVAGAGFEPAGAMTWRVQDTALGKTIRVPDAAGQPRCIVIGANAAALVEGPVLALDTWRWLDLQAGVPLIQAATVDKFVPQMLNYEIVGGVDFKKGCYPGQEVVARSQYRGTIKRRTALAHVAGETDTVHAGIELFHSDDPGQPCGMIVNAAAAPAGGVDALVEIKLAALDSGTVHLGAADGPTLAFDALPYAWPTEA